MQYKVHNGVLYAVKVIEYSYGIKKFFDNERLRGTLSLCSYRCSDFEALVSLRTHMVALLSFLTHIIATFIVAVAPIIVAFAIFSITNSCLSFFSSSMNWVALQRAGSDLKYKTPFDLSTNFYVIYNSFQELHNFLIGIVQTTVNFFF